jgi:hypothetical protein
MSQPIETLSTATLTAARKAGVLVAGGAFDAPRVDPVKARSTLTQLGIPTQGRVLVTFAHDLCTTHDFRELEKAAAQNNVKLYVVYGNPNEPGLDKPMNHDKVSIGVIENGKSRSLKAEKIILAKKGSNLLTIEELKQLANTLGFTVKQDGDGMSSSNGAAIYENGSFQRIIPVPKKAISSINAPLLAQSERSNFARA